MAKPAILTVDDDPAVSQAISRDLRRQYGAEFQIIRTASGAEAMNVLTEFALRDRQVGLIASDQRMPEMTGVEFLEQARVLAPEAKLVLLTAYADTDVAIKAINDIGLDYYLLKPWDPPEERLYPVLDDLLSDWREEHPGVEGGLRVVGHRWSERSHDIKTFLTRNHIHYRWLDLEHDEEAQRLHDAADADPADLPLVLVPDREPLRAPSVLVLADALGLRTIARQPLYDLCVVGGGPAGLAAAVYAASEGLQTVVIEREAPGGQAGQSASIENYLGFPKGVSGADLAHRAVAQAQRFGAEMVLARDVVGLETSGPARTLHLDGGAEFDARTVLVATGVSYRRLDVPGFEELGGRGVYYGATASQARSCEGDDVYLVGAANSAGQAALNIARFARRVVLLVRSDSLEKSMSPTSSSGSVPPKTSRFGWRRRSWPATATTTSKGSPSPTATAGTKEDVATNWLFVFIGASPRTDWLGDDVARDERGFIITGPDLMLLEVDQPWTLARPPLALETSVPGVFAAGDVGSSP